MVDQQLFAIIMYLQLFILIGPALIGWIWLSIRDYRQTNHEIDQELEAAKVHEEQRRAA